MAAKASAASKIPYSQGLGLLREALRTAKPFLGGNTAKTASVFDPKAFQ